MLPVTVAFTVAAALAMAAITLRHVEDTDTVIGVLWAAGMACGIILLDLSPGYKPDLMSYLFGSIITVPVADLLALAGLAVVLVAVTLRYYHGFVAMAFDREFAAVRGGTGHLSALPAHGPFRRGRGAAYSGGRADPHYRPDLGGAEPGHASAGSLGRAMVGATVLNLFFCLSGLALAYRFDLTSGAAIIAVAATVFFLSLCPACFRKRERT
jgi:zinc transport system permease protein